MLRPRHMQEVGSLSIHQKKLLVIDDDDLITDLVIEAASQLDIAGTAVHSFDDFKLALTRLEPDLILLDLVMPQVDGIQILRFLAER